MAKSYLKLNQFERNVKKFGHPKFNDGDKVTTSITGNDILTIKGNAWSNGHNWMYYFNENEYGLGQQYITKQTQTQ
jgi:hypothetical protein